MQLFLTGDDEGGIRDGIYEYYMFIMSLICFHIVIMYKEWTGVSETGLHGL